MKRSVPRIRGRISAADSPAAGFPRCPAAKNPYGRPLSPRRAARHPHTRSWRRQGPFRAQGSSRRHFRGKVYLRRSEEHTSELQSLMRISYAVFCLKKKIHRKKIKKINTTKNNHNKIKHT